MADSRTRNPVMRMSETLSTSPKPLRHKAYWIPSLYLPGCRADCAPARNGNEMSVW